MKLREFVLVLFALLLAGCAPAAGGPLATEVAVQATIFAPSPTPLQSEPPTAMPAPDLRPFVAVLLGSDYDPERPERSIYGIRTDVVAVMVIDPESDPLQVTLISFPRDLWVNVPCSQYIDDNGQAVDRINAAYYQGGFDCVADTIYSLTGLSSRGGAGDGMTVAYIEFEAFVNIADAFGGLDITPTADYLDFCGYYHGTDGNGGDWRQWRLGVTRHLNGNEVLCYTRGRRTPDGDLDRNRRQLEVLQAMKEQWWGQGFDVSDLDQVANALFGLISYVKTSVDPQDLIKYWPAIQRLGEAEIRSIRFTTDQTDFWTTPAGASVVVATVDIKPWLACMMHPEAFPEEQPLDCTVAFPAP